MTAARPLALANLLLTFALTPVYAADKPADKDALPAEVSFYKDVRPIFQQHCNGCHQPAKPSGGFVMTSRAELLKAGESDKPGVVPGRPDDSNLVAQVTPHDGKKPLMPRNQPPLPDRDVALINKWIAQGANPLKVKKWAGHASVEFTLKTYGHLWEDNEGDGRIAEATAHSPRR